MTESSLLGQAGCTALAVIIGLYGAYCDPPRAWLLRWALYIGVAVGALWLVLVLIVAATPR